MIRGYMAAHGGLAYLERPSARARRNQSRATAVTAILSMACATALIGVLAKTETAAASAPPAPSLLLHIRF